MSFISFTFLGFIIVLFIGYYLIPKRFQWIWLLVGSYFFYAYSTPLFAVFLLVSTVTTYIFPLQMYRITERQAAYFQRHKNELSRDEKKVVKAQNNRQKKRLMAVCVLINIGILAFLKYSNFVIGITNSLGLGISEIDWLILPLGISFYTFQSVGYAIDVYRETAEPQLNFFKYALYVSFFPSVSQGPIGRYNDLAPQLYKERKFNYDDFTRGLQRMLFGFFKKLVIANRIALFVNPIYNDVGNYSGLVIALATLMYAFQLYADFSGYMDIALGIGECLGIKLEENFKTPYFSKSIAEYWRRWHITLGSWFRDYIYYSILRSGWCMNTGKRLSKKGYKNLAKTLTTVVALLIVWLLIGMWHGASWNFILHGIYHGSFIILSVILAAPYLKIKKFFHINDDNFIWRCFQIIRTFFIVCIGYVLFRSASLEDAIGVYRSFAFDIVPKFGTGYFSGIISNQFSTTQWCVTAIVLGMLFIVEVIDTKTSFQRWLFERKTFVKWTCLYILMLATLFMGCYGQGDASGFIYFQF